MDITELIADDHTEQRRLFALIDQLTPDDRDALKAVWDRLRALLDTHARAEELYFYPELLNLDRGADGESPDEETRDAIKDHNEIRDAAAKVDKEELGSKGWFAAATALNQSGDPTSCLSTSEAVSRISLWSLIASRVSSPGPSLSAPWPSFSNSG